VRRAKKLNSRIVKPIADIVRAAVMSATGTALRTCPRS
jgi:hypothetical protein